MKYIRRTTIIILGVFVLFLIALFIIKFQMSGRIKHFKQYLIPGEGQVAFSKDMPVFLEFYFYDEERYSEMASTENISEVQIQTKDGELLEVNSWDISENEFLSQEYDWTTRKLSMEVALPKECELDKLIVHYPDYPEEFSTGNIKLVPYQFESDETSGNLLMDAALINYAGKRNDINSDCVFTNEFNCLEVLTMNYSDDIIINRIDLGIDGTKVDMNHVKAVQQETGINVKEMENHFIYGERRDVTEASEEGEVVIPSQKEMNYTFSVCKKAWDENNIKCYYCNPIFYLTVNGKRDCVYMNRGNCFVQTPKLLGEDAIKLAENLVEEKGK